MFVKLATTVAKNASGYKTKRACELAVHRVRKAWELAGCYGCDKHLLDDARWACILRWQELNGQELDAKWAS